MSNKSSLLKRLMGWPNSEKPCEVFHWRNSLCIPEQNGQPFRSKVGDDSGPKWAAIPPESGQNFEQRNYPNRV
jgi:hypothetical protein